MENIVSFFLVLADSLSLELTKVSIPSYKIHGDTATLECHYELKNGHESRHSRDHGYSSSRTSSLSSSLTNDNNGIDHHPHNGVTETLYSVKWYKDNEEFYRFIPKANPQQQSYKVDGVRVDVSSLLFIINTNRNTIERREGGHIEKTSPCL